MEDKTFHMTPDQFRQWGHKVVDWVADYGERVEDLPVLSQVKPGEIRGALPDQAPVQGESFDAIIKDLDEIILPGITHWQSPNFFAYFPANTSGPAILGELVAAGLAVQGMLWTTSPACTELETQVMDWIADMLALPEKFKSTGSGGGVIQDSASGGVLCAILAARERATDFRANARGSGGKLVAYVSSQTHSSVEKGLKIAGIGADNLRAIAVDDALAMDPKALARQIAADRQAGLEPFFVCATVGTTSSTAVDPVAAIGAICRENNLWFHVDGAMAGTAALCPEFRHFFKGWDLADSFCFNPHKWMFTNFDCSCFFVADRQVLINTLSILPEYLRNQASETGRVIDYRDWQVPLGRRFRALKLWFVIRHYGVEGLRHHIREHVALAREFARWVQDDEDFELSAPVPFNLVCFRHKGGDGINEQILETVNADGALYLTHTVLDGRHTLRMAIGQTHTTARHVQAAWEAIKTTAAKLGQALR